jgi:chromosome partitioning protein
VTLRPAPDGDVVVGLVAEELRRIEIRQRQGRFRFGGFLGTSAAPPASASRPLGDRLLAWRPMNIVVANIKGGVGKTTTAIYTSAAAVARGYEPVLLIDADRQASSAEWLEERPVAGVAVVEAPSERTLARAMSRHDGLGVVDAPPGDVRLSEAAATAADVVIIPTRAGGVEFSPVLRTLEMVPNKTPHGVVICAARLGTNDLEETITWWRRQGLRIWGVVPERVGIAAGPEAHLYREGLQHYDAVLRRALRARR